MTVPLLLSLQIENLRGAMEPLSLVFEKSKKLAIIYGENGAGKSTIADAFDLLGNGIVGSLEKRGIGGATRSYWPSVGKAHGDVKVVLSTSAGACTLSLGAKNAAVDNEHLKPQVAVLRRSQILNLIAAQPAERYKEISKFVDVSGEEASEASLRKLVGDKAKDFETATTRLSVSRTNIEHFWNEAGCPMPDAFVWAQAEAQKDQQELDKRKAAIDGLISHWDKIVPYPAKLIEFSGRLKAAQSAHAVAQASLRDITDEAAKDYLDVMNILQAAQHYFRNHPYPTTCPLCESSEKAEVLVAEVNRRIQAHGLKTKLEAAKIAAEGSAAAEQQARQRLDDFLKEASGDFNALKAYCDDFKELAGLEALVFPVPAEPDKWAEWIDANKGKREGWRQASDGCVDRKNFVATLRRSLNDYSECDVAAKDLASVLPRLREILKIMEDERRKYTDKILGDISTHVGELYEAIHPGEGLNKIVLALDSAKRGSLEIASEFGGKADTPPQAYFSDSHLDTLGMCVFLALAERDAPEEKIIVLDDVLSSVDEPHVERIIGVLYEVLQRFRHAIITTHYRPWREKFRWGLLKPDQTCQFVELGKWDINKGISLSGAMIPEIARLKTLLADPNPDVQAVTGKAGVILEALLDFLTLQYACAVPRKYGNTYVLGDLLGAVNGKLLSALKAETLAPASAGQVVATIELKPMLEKIMEIAQTRNVLGAHFNEAGFDLYPDDGIRFAKLVEQLADALVCPDHGRPMKDTGSYWRNGGDTRRLHPLKKPS